MYCICAKTFIVTISSQIVCYHLRSLVLFVNRVLYLNSVVVFDVWVCGHASVCECEWARVAGAGGRGAVSTRAPRLRRASHLLPRGHGKILFQIKVDTWYRNKSKVVDSQLLRHRIFSLNYLKYYVLVIFPHSAYKINWLSFPDSKYL